MDPNINPYAAPQFTNQSGGAFGESPELASRGARFGAAFIDGMIMLLFIFPVMAATGYLGRVSSGHPPEFTEQLEYALLGAVVFLVVQGYTLSKSGQTLGKKMVGIKIVDLDGSMPSFPRLALRSIVPQLIGIVPMIGGLFLLADSLFIFGGEKRCLHDNAAGTRVIVAN